jgi:hypothetical protein
MDSTPLQLVEEDYLGRFLEAEERNISSVRPERIISPVIPANPKHM